MVSPDIEELSRIENIVRIRGGWIAALRRVDYVEPGDAVFLRGMVELADRIDLDTSIRGGGLYRLTRSQTKRLSDMFRRYDVSSMLGAKVSSSVKDLREAGALFERRLGGVGQRE